jgi:hypothetical protein
MKKAIAVVLMLLGTNLAVAESPYDKFSADNNTTNKTTITWIPVDNIKQTCEAESKRRGFGGFGIPMEACTFWDKGITGNSCTIYTPRTVDYWIIGHEMRHCYQGSFHK